jgi:hypothetical protein
VTLLCDADVHVVTSGSSADVDFSITFGYKKRKVIDLCLKLLIGRVIYLKAGSRVYIFL